MACRRVTLAIPEGLMRRLRILADRQGTSISGLLATALSDLADREECILEARASMIKDMERGYDLGTRGQISWTRESLHEG